MYAIILILLKFILNNMCNLEIKHINLNKYLFNKYLCVM